MKTAVKSGSGKEMPMDVYDKIKALGLEIPSPTSKGRIFAAAVKMGEKIYITSGNNCKVNGKLPHPGRLGAEVDVEQGRQDARQCILNILGNVQNEISDLNEIKQIVKILGFVASADDFYDQPRVLDAASELLIDIFGSEAGRCARSAVGVNVLPNNQPVEIEMVFEVK